MSRAAAPTVGYRNHDRVNCYHCRKVFGVRNIKHRVHPVRFALFKRARARVSYSFANGKYITLTIIIIIIIASFGKNSPALSGEEVRNVRADTWARTRDCVTAEYPVPAWAVE